MQPSLPILRTKLHRPPVAATLVERGQLLTRLDAGRRLPLTLVSAPAGYGKTTVVSHWLESRRVRSAWVSLDETDDDLVAFLHYFVGAVRTLFPDACGHLLTALDPDAIPTLATLASLLCNDVDAIERAFVLALDDYHCLRNPSIHELIDRMLRHPPLNLHLVILCRSDPPLSLTSLRGRQRMTEIRQRDLQFNRDESTFLLRNSVGNPLHDTAVERLYRKTEGWPVALHLAGVALRQGSRELLEAPRNLSDFREVREYLVSEIVEHQSPDVRSWLHATSIFDRFCAPLCEAACGPLTSEKDSSLDGQRFLGLLEDKGLLSVALDKRREWFRYHHVFQDSLRYGLSHTLGEQDIARLHHRAAKWFESQGLIEEALHHLLTAGDTAAAASLIVRRRGEIAEHEHWHRLDRWLALLPPRLVAEDPELLILRAWSCDYRARTEEAVRILAEVEARLPDKSLAAADGARLRGEIAVLRSRFLFGSGESRAVRKLAEQALALFPVEYRNERAFAKMLIAAGLQREGEGSRAVAMLHEALEQEARDSPACRCRVLFTLCGLQWMDADLKALVPTSAMMLQLADEHQLADTAHLARFFQASVMYHRDRLTEAEALFEQLAEDGSALRSKYALYSRFAMALIRQARGQTDLAREWLVSASRQILASSNIGLLPLVEGLEAELALRAGRLAEAMRWAESFDAAKLPRGLEFHWLETTAVRIFLAQGTTASLAAAEKLLRSLRGYLESIHYQRFLIDVDVLEVLLHDRRGNEGAALDSLRRALARAQPGRWIRLFVDPGPELARWLRRLSAPSSQVSANGLTEDGQRYVEEILGAFRNPPQPTAARESAAATPAATVPPAPYPRPDPLTRRELEVLTRLGDKLSNKDIAARLQISSATVKRHTQNIYEKLGVHSRQEAVTEAYALGLLHRRE